ncbi:ABC transporter permease [Clostridium sp. LP20]|uniref:ABC transporter permease n=1 Tax=Clostridium sp. LP20 TaxID=3418665 RepID=UPI003EE5C7E4
MLNAFKSIKRLRMIAFLIIFQLALGLSLLNNVILQSKGAVDKKTAFNNMFNAKNTYVVRIREADEQLDKRTQDEWIKNQQKLSDDLYNLKGNGVITNVYSCFNSPMMLNSLIETYSNKSDKLQPQDQPKLYSALEVDKNFIDRYTFSVDEGRTIIKEDFNLDYKTQNIPILLGSDYKKDFKVGDVLNQTECIGYTDDTMDLVDANYEVVGFLKKDSVFSFFTKNSFFDSVTFSNSMIVKPANYFFYSSSFVALNDVGLFLEVNEGTTTEDVNRIVEEITNKVEKDTGLKHISGTIFLKDQVGDVNEKLQNDVNVKLLLGIVLTILSVIGITTTILGEFKERRKEFGTRLAIGASTKDLCKELVYEILIMVSIAVIISNIYLKLTLGVYKLSPIILIINIVIILIFTLIISLLPIVVLRKYNVIDLLKED